MSIWKHIAFAPRDGRELRIRSDAGDVIARAKFSPPHHWTAPYGIIRLADDVLAPPSPVLRAVQFQEL